MIIKSTFFTHRTLTKTAKRVETSIRSRLATLPVRKHLHIFHENYHPARACVGGGGGYTENGCFLSRSSSKKRERGIGSKREPSCFPACFSVGQLIGTLQHGTEAHTAGPEKQNRVKSVHTLSLPGAKFQICSGGFCKNRKSDDSGDSPVKC